MDALVRNWWMIAVRGVLAIVFGLSILFWPNVQLGIVVILFGTYAILDGVWAFVAAVRASERRFGAWPVALEGVASVAIGLLAIVSPFVPRGFVSLIALWGIVTGAMELVAAARVPRDAAGHWWLATGGASSVFLAVGIVILRHAELVEVAMLLAIYAILFGVFLSGAALCFRKSHPRATPPRIGVAA